MELLMMGSYLVLLEDVTIISDPAAFAKEVGVTRAELERLPTGHYLELENHHPPPARFEDRGLNAAHQRGLRRRQRTLLRSRHRAVIRLDEGLMVAAYRRNHGSLNPEEGTE